jgi:hypothetical protein
MPSFCSCLANYTDRQTDTYMTIVMQRLQCAAAMRFTHLDYQRVSGQCRDSAAWMDGGGGGN